MKAYFITTGMLFGMMAVVHVWRPIVEWPHSTIGLGFVLEMAGLIILPGALSWWAWRCLRSLSADRIRQSGHKIQPKDPDNSAA